MRTNGGETAQFELLLAYSEAGGRSGFSVAEDAAASPSIRANAVPMFTGEARVCTFRPFLETLERLEL